MTTRDNPYSRDFPERPTPGFGQGGSTGGPGYGQGPGYPPGPGGMNTGMQRPGEQARERAGQLTEQAKEQTKSFLDSQRERIAEGLGSMATALHQTSQQLYQQDRGAVAQYANRAADTVERASSYLHTTDTDQMLSAAERYARREPAVFLGGALALGFLGARFLKSSRRHDNVQSGRFPPPSYRGGPYSANFPGGPTRPEEA